jgi:hypothetical protein
LKHIISLGAGVQSSTMALMAAAGEILPMPDCAIFADTHAEPRAVYDWLDWLTKQLPFPVIRVSQGNLGNARRAGPSGNELGRAVNQAGATGGSLNPTWVEWLMGFPLGWTALEPSETPSSRRSRKSSGGRS